MTRPLVVCADDYGMSDGVSRGIVALAAAGRISATGAMANLPAWRDAAAALAPLAGRIGVGLHLTLTWGAPLAPGSPLARDGRFPSLPRLMAASLSGRLDREDVAREIESQLDAFEAGLGRPPDFVDGHQHVHVLPGIRSALVAALRRRAYPHPPWLRDPADAPAAILRRGGEVAKAAIVGATALGFGAAARAAGFRTNRGFAGFSAFDPAADLAADFDRFLRAPGPAHLVMCHPGHVAPGEALDGVTDARMRERDFLASDAWPALLAAHGLGLRPSP